MLDNSNYYNLGGSVRCKTAQETLIAIKPHCKSLGISRVAHITGLDTLGIPVTTCIRPTAKHLSVSQGKGLTQELADISAIMESIETYHLENPAPPLCSGSYNHSKNTDNYLSPLLFTQTYLNNQDLENSILPWASASCLIKKEKYLIPHALTSLDTTKTAPERYFFAISSNGLAAGNTLDEAICHSLYELIERDALFAWKNLSPAAMSETQVDIFSIEDENSRIIIDNILKKKFYIKIWDITSQHAIPAFHCAIMQSCPIQGNTIFTGTGAHSLQDIALYRAISEAAQSRLTLISGNRDDIYPDFYQSLKGNATDISKLYNNGTKKYSDCGKIREEIVFSQEKNYILNRLKKNGVNNILFIDHTKKSLGIPVVQCISPCLKFDGRRI